MSEKSSSEGHPGTTIEVLRHAPKKLPPEGSQHDATGESVDISDLETVEGAERKAEEMFARLQEAPAGTIMAIQPSNIERANKTVTLLRPRLQKLAEGISNTFLIELGIDEATSLMALNTIRQHPEQKFIIPDLKETWLLGFKEHEPLVAGINEWMDKFKRDEDLVGKLWASWQSEIGELHKEVSAAGLNIGQDKLTPSSFGVTPEAAALRQIDWMLIIKKLGQKYFPDRYLMLEGISHHWRSDFVSMALLGQRISLASINKVLGGHFREPYVGSTLTFAPDGSLEFNSNNQRIQYTSEEFTKRLAQLKLESKERQGEWAKRPDLQ